MSFLYKADPERGAIWRRLFAEQAPDLPFRIWPDIGDPLAVRYFAVWVPPEDLTDRFPNLEILFSVGAGVDQIDFSRVPADLPVVRMVEPGIIDSMVEYATLATLALHRDLGGIPCFAGAGTLPDFLARTDILICLLPLIEETRGVLNRDLFARLPAGAALINTGRGGHLVDADLLAALDAGQLSAAVLDVASIEPLPDDHPFWRHPRILLTPHIASATQPDTAVSIVVENIRRHRRGEPLVGLVDRTRGY